MFFLHFSFVVDSAILLTMALDRYVAICFPLRYTSLILRWLSSLWWALSWGVVILPDVFLLKRVALLRNTNHPHTYCEHIGVSRFLRWHLHQHLVWIFSFPPMTALSQMWSLLLSPISSSSVLPFIFHPRVPAKRHSAPVVPMSVSSSCFTHSSALLSPSSPIAWAQCTSKSAYPLLAQPLRAIPPALNPIVYGVKHQEKIQDKFVLLFYFEEDTMSGEHHWRRNLGNTDKIKFYITWEDIK